MEEESISQVALAKKYNVNQSSLSRFLKGERKLPGECFLSLLSFVYPEIKHEPFNVPPEPPHEQ